MFQNYFKIALRNLFKNKIYSILNIGGLTIGLTCCLLIGLYIRHERSFDQYHAHANEIFRVIQSFEEKPENYQVWGCAPIGPALQKDFPEIQQVAQFSGRSDILLTHNGRSFQEENLFFADSTVFDVFSWPLIAGDAATALSAPYALVLTESTARKYFGSENPIGKTLEGSNAPGRADAGVYTVTGVMKDIPANSHFTFDLLASMNTFRRSWADPFGWWGYVDFYTYFRTSNSFDIQQIKAKTPDFLARNISEDQQRHYHIDFEALPDVYLHSSALRQPGTTGNLSSLYIFGLIGLFILIIACINFMNLATARSMERAREVGVRKVVGAGRKTLILQFLGESLIMVLIAGILAPVLVGFSTTWLSQITGRPLQVSGIFNAQMLPLYFTALLLTGLLAGSYPAFLLSGFRPIRVLKGIYRASNQGVALRKGLVIFQFSLSIALIAGTLVVFSQLQFMQQRDLGFNKEQMLVIDYNYDETVGTRLESIKNTFKQHPQVLSVSASRSVPGSNFPNAGTRIASKDGTMLQKEPAIFEVDVDYIPHFGIEMAAGRAYSRDFPRDTAFSLVVNEACAKWYGYANPEEIIGKKFSQWGKEGEVIGVVKDFNYLSLHRKVEPLTIRLEPFSSRYLVLRIQSDDLPKTISEIGQIWTQTVPHRPYLYSFLDESFNRQYQADLKFRQLFTLFSGLAILIACLGLFGLATYAAEQRKKEIGIRKVLGAQIPNIIVMLSKDFIGMVLIAIVIATPLAWFAMNRWLQVFAYQTTIHWWMFAAAGASGIAIALFTISFQSIRAALSNPVKALRSE